MECLGQLCSIVPCLWDCSAKHSAYITALEDNLNSLRTAMEELNNLSQDIRNKVSEAEEQHRRPRNQVNGWLRSVEALENKVNPILEKGTREIENKCVGSCCPKNCWSSYKLGKEVLKMLPKVQGLVEKGNGFDDVADDNLVAARVDELPMEGPVVGFESKFEEVWQSVQDEESSIIGLVGIGGVGKTTLLKQLNNEFSKTIHRFDLVIWIVVSKPADLGRIRDTIRAKINIADHLWESKSEDQRASLIYNELKEKKFVVLLDDLWATLRLSEVGIPIPQRGVGSMSRIVFTTRFEEVCHSLDAHKIIRVGCLPPDKAFDLFISKVGEDVLKSNPQIKQLVKDVASECGGLPLALITIGRAMRDKKDAQQWKDAKRTLMMYPSTFPGVKGEIFSKLVFSYESLPTQTIQKCFEYCSIFPEDHNIGKETLTKLWVAEGIIDEYDNMHDAFIQGRKIIESLMQACLLEVGEEEGKVKMHDVIRDMALWLACERGEKKNKFLIVDVISSDDHGPSAMAKWRNAEKASLWGPGAIAGSLAGLSFSSNLITLIIKDRCFDVLPIEILQSMKVLKVLDLSHNSRLLKIDGIGSLVNLEYLNITETRVRRLPVDADQLKKLRFLFVNYTTSIPKKFISNLSWLQAFEQKIGSSGESNKEDTREEGEMIVELAGLKHIMDVCLVIDKASSVRIFLDCPKVQSCTRELVLKGCESLAEFDLSIGRFTERLEIKDCDLSVIRLVSTSLDNLCHVSIIGCEKLQNANPIVYMSYLCTLVVKNCISVEELIAEGGTMDNSDTLLFSSLKSLTLWNLPKLWSICPQIALPFPSLVGMEIRGCESLKKLPLDSNTANTTPPEFTIVGYTLWWFKLEWESQAIRDAFAPKFQQDYSIYQKAEKNITVTSSDDLPRIVAAGLNQGSAITSMDFHPVQPTLLLVGTNIGDIAIWEVGSRKRLIFKTFKVSNLGACSMALQASLADEYTASVNRVVWSPEGALFGVAYSKHLVQIYFYDGGEDRWNPLEIDAHVGNVFDLAFSHPNRQLFLVTCGEDKTVKVWDAINGQKKYTMEGHEAPVYSICPHQIDNIHFFYSTAIDGKTKAWLYDFMGSRVDYDANSGYCIAMAYSADGTRLFSCGTSKEGESLLIEWNESYGVVKRNYQGLGKKPVGVVQFDTTWNRFLAVGDEFQIKIWDMDDVNLFTTIDAEGQLPASPCIRFNSDGTLLAFSTDDNGVKILANADGVRLLRSTQNLASDASKAVSGNA